MYNIKRQLSKEYSQEILQTFTKNNYGSTYEILRSETSNMKQKEKNCQL